MAEFTRQDFNQAAGEAGQTGFKWVVRGAYYAVVSVLKFGLSMLKQIVGQ